MAKYILKEKHSNTDEMWLYAWEHISELISREEAEALVQKAVARVKAVVGDKRVGYGWSGGKDAMALQVVMERAGITTCGISYSEELCFPKVLEWCRVNAPAGLQFINNPDFNLAWMKKHEQLLFTKDNAKRNNLYGRCIRKGWKLFADKNGLDMVLLGKRMQDGNVCGKGGQYVDAQGLNIFCPIYDWKHEDCLAVNHYFNGGRLPYTYFLKDGFRHGVGHSWGILESGWDELYTIDPDIVVKASQHFASAAEYLKSINK